MHTFHSMQWNVKKEYNKTYRVSLTHTVDNDDNDEEVEAKNMDIST